MNLARLTLDEIICRARQEGAKRIDRVTSALRTARRGHVTSEARVRPDSGWTPEDVSDVMSRRFFPGLAERDLGGLVARINGASAKDLLHHADRLMRGRFDLLGYVDLDFGQPIDWCLDPIAGRRAPTVHWSRIDPLDEAVVGDSKVIWEINRHQWVVTLAQASRVSGDQRYAERAMASIEAWTDANPYGIGINWSSSLEVALRLVSWCWTLMLLHESPAMSPRRYQRCVDSAKQHATHITRFLSHYYSPNTHLTGEALGLFYAGVVFADTPQAAAWRDLGRRILVEQLEKQVSGDGVYFEQASCYHRYTIEFYLHFLMLAAQNGIAVPAEVGATVSRMFDWLLSVGAAEGRMPSIGDADGGWLMPLTPRHPADCRGVYALGAVLFDRSDLAWAAGVGEPAAEITWCLGSGGVERLDAMERRPPALPSSRFFEAGGYVVMRDGWNADANRLVFDTGALGCPISGAHGHADLLSVLCSAFGEEYLIDGGTFCYTGDPVWRDYFRSTAAHNTIRVDGRSQADPAGPFSWRDRPSARVDAWESAPDFDYVDAHHRAYGTPDHPVTHRRRVLFVKSYGWVLVDDVMGEGTHDVDLRFHLSPRPVSAMGEWIRAGSASGHALWMLSAASQPLTSTIRGGGQSPIEGWHAPHYGARVPIPTVVHAGSVTLPVRIATVIAPVRSPLAEPPAIEIERDAANNPVAVAWTAASRVIRIGPEAMSLVEGKGRLLIA